MAPMRNCRIVSLILIISLGSLIDLSDGFPTVIDFPEGDASAGGSKCPGTACVKAPSGTECQATYSDMDNCCPTWVCANGQRAYGRASAAGVAWKSDDGSSSGYSYSSGITVSDRVRYDDDGQSPTGYSQKITSDDGNSQMSRSSYSSSSSSKSGFGQGQPMNYGFAAPGQIRFGGVLPRINSNINNPFLPQQAAAVAMFGGGFFGR